MVEDTLGNVSCQQFVLWVRGTTGKKIPPKQTGNQTKVQPKARRQSNNACFAIAAIDASMVNATARLELHCAVEVSCK